MWPPSGQILASKKLLIWAKNCPIFCSKLPRSQKWRYQEFLLHQKMAKEGSKNQKKIFFQKKYSKDGKKNFGTSGTIISFFENLRTHFGRWPYPPYPPRTVPRSRPLAEVVLRSASTRHFLWYFIYPTSKFWNQYFSMIVTFFMDYILLNQYFALKWGYLSTCLIYLNDDIRKKVIPRLKHYDFQDRFNS